MVCVGARCLFTAPPGAQQQLSLVNEQTVGGLTACQICLLIQTLSLDPLVTCNTYLLFSITQNAPIQTHFLACWHWLQRGVYAAAALSFRRASGPEMLWIVCSCDLLLSVYISCGLRWRILWEQSKDRKKGLLLFAVVQWSLLGHIKWLPWFLICLMKWNISQAGCDHWLCHSFFHIMCLTCL